MASAARVRGISAREKHKWSQYMQRRVMRLLRLHDRREFQGRFRLFYTHSDQPILPVFQQYDRYLKLTTLCEELLEDIMPRIRLQLSLSTHASRQQELPPTRGEIDWEHTIRTSLAISPGLAPLLFETRLRQRDTSTPENLLTVAILLETRANLQGVYREEPGDEDLSIQELDILAGIDERIERELAAPYARLLLEEAHQVEIADLVGQVEPRLRLGPNPYRDLIEWRERLQSLRIGRTKEKAVEQKQTLSSKPGQGERDNFENEFYQIWILLEFAHFLIEENRLDNGATEFAYKQATLTFRWGGRLFRLRYNREHPVSGSWENAPGVRPDYLIERVDALHVLDREGNVTWSEPAVALDAKYYTTDKTYADLVAEPIRKMLSDMALTYTSQIILFFPNLLLPEETPGPFKKVVRSKPGRYRVGWQQTQEIRLCELSPGQRIDEQVKPILRAVLDHATAHLPVRSAPVCEGVPLNPPIVNTSGQGSPIYNAICPKRHIGPDVVDFVNIEDHCMKNSRLCHIIGQAGVISPHIASAHTQSG